MACWFVTSVVGCPGFPLITLSRPLRFRWHDHCDKCNSLACFRSPCYVPVSKWKCYQKKYQNK